MATTAWQLARGPVRDAPRRPVRPARLVSRRPAGDPAPARLRPARRPTGARSRPRWARAGAVLAVALVLAGAAAWPAGADVGPGGGAQPAAVRVVLRPGDTVWDLARLHAPAGTPHTAYVRRVLAANDVDPAALRPGAVLVLPGQWAGRKTP